MGKPASPAPSAHVSAATQPAGLKPALPLDVVKRSNGTAAKITASRHKLFWYARFLPVILAIAMFGGVIGLYFQPPGLRLVMSILGLQPGAGTQNPIAVPAVKPRLDATTAKATIAPGLTVAGIGKLLPQDDVITIAPPYGAGDARIATLKVREGDSVSAGDLLAVLDNERTLQAALDAADATVSAREAVLRQTRESVQASREEAKASLSRAQAAIVSSKRDLDRVTGLRAKGIATDVTYDQKRATHDQAVQDVERAKATLSRYTVDAADQQADILVAARNIDSAKAEFVRAQADLEKAYVRAPASGTILTVHVRPGEKPTTQGILNLGNLDTMTAEIEVYQTQIGAVAVGSKVTITADALPTTLDGTVTRIGLEVGKQSVTDASPAANTDARVMKVYVALNDASRAIARRFTNLQVTARIATGVAQ